MIRTLVGALSGLLLATAPLRAQTSASQVVTFEVRAVNELAFHGAPVLRIEGAEAGRAPTPVSAHARYAITTNENGRRITAQLASELPAGVTLHVALEAPPGATSAGSVRLGTLPQDVVTGLSRVQGRDLAASYTLSAAPDAGVVQVSTRVVIFTLLGSR